MRAPISVCARALDLARGKGASNEAMPRSRTQAREPWWSSPLAPSDGGLFRRLLPGNVRQPIYEARGDLDHLRTALAGETDPTRAREFATNYRCRLGELIELASVEGISGAVLVDAAALFQLGGFAWRSSPLLRPACATADDAWSVMNRAPHPSLALELYRAAVVHAMLDLVWGLRGMLQHHGAPSSFAPATIPRFEDAARSLACARTPLEVSSTTFMPEADPHLREALLNACAGATSMVHFHALDDKQVFLAGISGQDPASSGAMPDDKRTERAARVKFALSYICDAQTCFTEACAHAECIPGDTPLYWMLGFFRMVCTALCMRTAALALALHAIEAPQQPTQARVNHLFVAQRALALSFRYGVEAVYLKCAKKAHIWVDALGAREVESTTGELCNVAWKDHAANVLDGARAPYTPLDEGSALRTSDNVASLTLAVAVQSVVSAVISFLHADPPLHAM